MEFLLEFLAMEGLSAGEYLEDIRELPAGEPLLEDHGVHLLVGHVLDEVRIKLFAVRHHVVPEHARVVDDGQREVVHALELLSEERVRLVRWRGDGRMPWRVQLPAPQGGVYVLKNGFPAIGSVHVVLSLPSSTRLQAVCSSPAAREDASSTAARASGVPIMPSGGG